MTVDHELGVGLEAFDEGLGALDFLAEDVEERFGLKLELEPVVAGERA